MLTTEQKSKLLARWLRHRPDAIDLKLDSRGGLMCLNYS
jgi:putative RNA 2'-phosphotransferase